MNRRDFLRGLAGFGCMAFAEAVGRVPVDAEEARRAARRWLAARQSADGAWRSARYGAFRSGDALTPLALWALGEADLPAVASGRRWLERLTDAQAAGGEVRLAYPLFTAGYAARFFAAIGDRTRADVWAKVVLELQTTAALGWPAGDPACGAWGDSPAPPRRPAGVEAVPDMLAPNLSATLLGVQALVVAGRGNDARAALPFIESCQNFAPHAGDEFDDGGFFFAPGDPVRNKAGVAGRNSRGRVRFRSYGATTCDGYLASRECGRDAGHPRVDAAAEWLRSRTHGLRDGGDWPADRAAARESLVFYHAQALAEVLGAMRGERWARREIEALGADLIGRQRCDGSWQGEAPASCEDEPIVATAFALRALGCARYFGGSGAGAAEAGRTRIAYLS